MRGSKDHIVWAHFDKIEGTKDAKCKYCEKVFQNKPSAQRLRHHLLGIQGGGIVICEKVPQPVKDALWADERRRFEAGSTSNAVNNSIPILASLVLGDEPEDRGQSRETRHGAEGNFDQGEQNGCARSEGIPNINDVNGANIVREGEDQVQERGNHHVQDHGLNDSNKRRRIEAGSGTDVINNSISLQHYVEFENQDQAQVTERRQAGDQDTERGNVSARAEEEMESENLEDKVEELVITGPLLPTANLVGQAFKKDMDTIWECLESDEVSTIGIDGMGGVGKTTLVKHIHNRLLEDRSKFLHVYWVTVTRDFSIEKLQNRIAKTIGLDINCEEDIMTRASLLSKELCRQGKVVLILDDLWDQVDIKEVGMPVEVNGCKLIVTTRDLGICTWKLNCQKIINVQPLSVEEAWKLFLDTLGHNLAPGVEETARSIAKECDGLPLGIITMAGCMRKVEDINEWVAALTDLQNSKARPKDMGPEVFSILRFSYTRLDEALQKCLLYCALYPEDFKIERVELIEHLIVEEIVVGGRNRRESFAKGHTMLNELKKVCLLECMDDGKVVKMHDLIRDMAIQIMKEECPPSIVEAGKQLECLPLPEKKFWGKDIARVSLMVNDIETIPAEHLPTWPNLSTLLLCRNPKLISMTSSLFDQLSGLEVLDLSETRIMNLPESVAKLENLTALFLRGCWKLTDVPSLARLGALEVLDLLWCHGVKKVPEGLGALTNLKYLNIMGTGVKELPDGILTNLSNLQFLAFNTSCQVNGRELVCLSKLETLMLNLYNQEYLKKFIHLLSTMQLKWKQPSQYFLRVGPYDDGFGLRVSNKDVTFLNGKMSREVLLPRDVQSLAIGAVSIEDGKSLCLKNAIELKHFCIFDCEEIENLFCLSSSSPSIFQGLETLEIYDVKKLGVLFSREIDDILRSLPNDAFSNLTKFKIYSCPRMKKLFPRDLLTNLKNLQEIEVLSCRKMEEIIASEEEEEEVRSNSRNHSICNHPPQFNLPNLRLLKLVKLPKLKSICNGTMECNFLQKITVNQCGELTKIPISLPLQSLESIEIYPNEWWDLVEWGSFQQKIELLPKCVFVEIS